MEIRKAEEGDFGIVKDITQGTIAEIYPHYYPAGAVAFFLKHHCDENISRDIAEGIVYILFDNDVAVGTVTLAGTEINRLFVLPKYQGKGYGRALLDFAEDEITKHSVVVALHSSLPAKKIYLKRGYRVIENRCAMVGDNDYLCVDIMAKYFG